MSSTPANGIFLTKKLKTKIKMPNGWRTIESLVHKIRLHVDEGKEWLNPSRDKNKDTHLRKKVDEKSCVTFLLCDPGWYVQRTCVQNEWDENTHTHTHLKEWTDCVRSDIRAFGTTGDWKATALKAEVWVETVAEGGRRFMAAWRKEEVDAARHRQEKREATSLGKLLLSHTEA